MMTCNYCQTEIGADWRFCKHCGQPIPAVSADNAEDTGSSQVELPPTGQPHQPLAGEAGTVYGTAALPAPGDGDPPPSRTTAGRQAARAADAAAPSAEWAGVPSLRAAVGRVRRSDQVVAGGALVLLVSLFLPWFGFAYGGFSSGLSAHGWLILVLLSCIGLLAYLGWRAVRTEASSPSAAHWQGLIVVTCLSCLLTVIGVTASPPFSSLRIGAIIALVAALASVGGAVATRFGLLRAGVTSPGGQRWPLLAVIGDLLGRLPAAIKSASVPPATQRPAPAGSRAATETGTQPLTKRAVSVPAGTAVAAEAAQTRADSPTTARRHTGVAAQAPRLAGRRAVQVIGWGGSLALLGWAVWLVSLWKAAHPPSASLSCTIGQPAPVPGYGTCTPAVQKILADLSSGSNQSVASQWPDYHMNLAGIGVALALALLAVAYFYAQPPSPSPSPPGASGAREPSRPAVTPRSLWLAAMVLSAMLAGVGALMVHTLRQLSSAISEAATACSAVGAGNCVSTSAFVALISGWLSVGGGILAVLGALLCARSVPARMRLVQDAAVVGSAVQMAPGAVHSAQTVNAAPPADAASNSPERLSAARQCDQCHALVPSEDRFCSQCGHSAPSG